MNPDSFKQLTSHVMDKLKFTAVFLSVFTGFCIADAEDHRLLSPDGGLAVVIHTNPALTVSAVLNDDPVIAPSPLGITLEKTGRFPDGFRVTGDKRGAIDETYAMPVGKQSRCRNHANEMTLDFANDAGARVSLIVRAYDEGFAYRYRIDGDGPDTAAAEEASGIKLPVASTAWLASYSPYYENHYQRVDNWTAMKEAIQVPALFRTPEGAWVLVTEAAVGSDFSGSRLMVRDAASGLLGFHGDGTSTSPRPWLMPWRVIMVSRTLKPLVESNLVLHLSPPSRIADTSWIQPGGRGFSHGSPAQTPTTWTLTG
jgi:alpha-glucosidase